MTLLQFGNMDKDTANYNTRLFAERVMPQIADLFEDEWENHWWPTPMTREARTVPPGDRGMSDPEAQSVDVNGHPCRVWEKGSGEPLGFFPGIGGAPRWTPFMEALSVERRVIVPSLPGFPGAHGHDILDSHLDWMIATHELLIGAGLEGAGSCRGRRSAGRLRRMPLRSGRTVARRLVLISPYGLYDAEDSGIDPFAARPGGHRAVP